MKLTQGQVKKKESKESKETERSLERPKKLAKIDNKRKERLKVVNLLDPLLETSRMVY